MRRTASVLPWLVAGGLLAWVLARTDEAALGDALAAAKWARYGLAALGFTTVWLLLDALVLARLVTRFHRPVPFARMLPLRGATYLLLPLSYDAAQAALGLALRARFGIPIVGLAGTFLFYYLVDLLTISGLATLGSVVTPLASDLFRPVVTTAFLVVLGVLALGIAWARWPLARLPGWLRGARLLASLRRCRTRDLLEFAAWRALFYASFVVFAAITLPTFGVDVPLVALIALVPIVMSVSALPITVAGVGSTQAIMWILYGPYSDASTIVAYALVYNATLVLLRLPIGLAFLPAASPWRRAEERSGLIPREEVPS